MCFLVVGYGAPQTAAMQYGISYRYNSDHSGGNLTNFNMDLGIFLATRGDYAWLGYDWMGCGCGWEYHGKMPCDIYQRPDELDLGTDSWADCRLAFMLLLVLHQHVLDLVFVVVLMRVLRCVIICLFVRVIICLCVGVCGCDQLCVCVCACVCVACMFHLHSDYGTPSGLCSETATDSGVFVRQWTKSTVTVDCNTYTTDVRMK